MYSNFSRAVRVWIGLCAGQHRQSGGKKTAKKFQTGLKFFLFQNGTFLGAIITALLLSVSGFLLFFSHIPKLLYPLSYISFMGFAMEGIVQAMYDDRTALSCPEDVAYCHYRFPELLRRDIGMEKNNFWVDVGYLLCVCIVLRVISFCNLRRKLSST